MVLQEPISDLEKAKFFRDLVDNEVTVRTSGKGTYTPLGLHVGQVITTMMVGDTAVKIPAVPLSDRNELVIQNLSTTDTLYFGNSNVTADRVVGITSGFEISPNAFQNISITDDIEIYGIVESGKSIMIKVWEVA